MSKRYESEGFNSDSALSLSYASGDERDEFSKKGRNQLKKRKKPTGVAKSLIKEISENNLGKKTRIRSANRLVDGLQAEHRKYKISKIKIKHGYDTPEEVKFNQKYEFNKFSSPSPMNEKSYLRETLQSCDESDELSWNDSEDSDSDKKKTTRSYKSGR